MLDRGAIYLAKLYPSKGSEPGKTRPVLILQTNMLNHIRHTTTIIIPLTTKLVHGAYPLRYYIKKRENLLQDSELLCDQVRAVDVQRVIPEKLATLTMQEMVEIEHQVQSILDFE